MHEAPSLHGLAGAATRWSGHHCALAARLGQPGAVRLTEEQEAMSLGIAGRLVRMIAGQMPLKTDIANIWARWEATGIPSAPLIAPSIFARVEEYRWRRMMTGPLHDPLPGLFADMAGKRRSAALLEGIGPEGIAPEAAAAVDAALLALRIADGARSDAFGLPLLLPAELPPASLRALLFDAGAQDLAQAGDLDSRAPEIAAAVESAMTRHQHCAIDAAARAYAAAVEQVGLLAAATSDAMARHDWLAVIAVAAAKAQLRFADAAAALVVADEDVLRQFFVALGLSPAATAPLLDSIAEIPGRPGAALAESAATDSEDMVMAVAARAESLRARQRGDAP